MSYFEDRISFLCALKGVHNVTSCNQKKIEDKDGAEEILESQVDAGDELPDLPSKYDSAAFCSFEKENINPNVKRKSKRGKKQQKPEKKKEKSFCDLSDSDDDDKSGENSANVSNSLTLLNFKSGATADYDEKDNGIILDDKHFKSIMLSEISEDYMTHKDDEDYILKQVENDRIIELHYKDEGKNHYFTTKIDGKNIKINVVEAIKLFAHGENELKKILKKKIICSECGDIVLEYDSFNIGNYYLCVECSCKDKYKNLDRIFFIDPLKLEPAFNKYRGINLYCRKHKNYSHISRFTTITKDNKRKFHKECHDCRLRYKVRDGMIKKFNKDYNLWRTCRV